MSVAGNDARRTATRGVRGTGIPILMGIPEEWELISGF